jgi:hypothetical protein
MSTPVSRTAILALTALAAACSTEPSACTASIEPGIVVGIRDSVTGAPLAEQATGQVEEHLFADSLWAYEASGDPLVLLSRASAFERPGRYIVTVVAPGYATWIRNQVEVRAGACHVGTVHLDARLQPI